MHEMIQDDIIKRILSGEFQTDSRVYSESEIVNSYGVSRITATKVLNELAKNKYIYRIQGKGSFVGAQPQRPLYNIFDATSLKKTKHVAFVGPFSNDYHSIAILQGLRDVLVFPDFALENLFTATKEEEEYFLQYVLEKKYDGLVFFPTDCTYYSDVALQMVISKYPLVLIDRSFQGIDCHSITTDNPLGITLAIDHLLTQGHKKIGFMHTISPEERITSTRRAAYVDYMIKKKMLPVLFNCHNKETSYCRNKIKQHLENNEITAMITCNSSATNLLHQIANELHANIPDDLSIVAFDKPEVTLSKDSFYTYIEQNSYSMGYEAARFIQKIIQTEYTETENIVLAPKLQIYHSVRCLNL